MKNLSNTEAELKKTVAYEKSLYISILLRKWWISCSHFLSSKVDESRYIAYLATSGRKRENAHYVYRQIK